MILAAQGFEFSKSSLDFLTWRVLSVKVMKVENQKVETSENFTWGSEIPFSSSSKMNKLQSVLGGRSHFQAFWGKMRKLGNIFEFQELLTRRTKNGWDAQAFYSISPRLSKTLLIFKEFESTFWYWCGKIEIQNLTLVFESWAPKFLALIN
jgi:hypothetical protein